MSNRHISQPEDPSALRDRIADIFNPSSSGRFAASDRNNTTEHSHDDTHDDTHDDAPDDRTRLLAGYDRRESACGQSECSHGTFSPRPEHQYDSESQGANYFWGFRTPRFVNSGIQTPVTDGTSVTHRLGAEIGAKRRRKLYDHKISPMIWTSCG
jgi:hypothetical protein